MNNRQRSQQSSIIQQILFYGMVAYSAWTIWIAYRHGMYTWGSLGDYSLSVYVMTLGLVSSAYIFLQHSNNGVRASFLLLFMGFNQALTSVGAMSAVPGKMGWMFDFIGYVAGFTVIAAGIVLEEQMRTNRRTRARR